MERPSLAYQAELRIRGLRVNQFISSVETQHANPELDRQFNGFVTFLAEKFTVGEGEAAQKRYNDRFILGTVIAMLEQNPSDEWLHLKSAQGFHAASEVHGQRGALSDQETALRDSLEEMQALQEGRKLQQGYKGYNEKLIMLYIAAHNKALEMSNAPSPSSRV